MISIIAAIGQNRELGKDNKLLWNIPEDLAHFKRITAGHPIIMGRKTWDSLPFKPLPKRTNIIITRDLDYQAAGAIVVHSLQEARTKVNQEKDETFIIGGGQIFKEALPIVDRLYLTIVHKSFDADTFFPDYSQFTKVVSEEDGDSSDYEYSFITLEK